MIRLFYTALMMLMMAALPATPAFAAVSISACGTVVTQPGDYTVTQDMFCEAGQDGILVLSSDVTIDLNRHTVTCIASAPGAAPVGAVVVGDYVDPDLVLENVIIKNGTVTACNDGVVLFYTSGTEVTKMFFSDNVGSGLILVSAENTLAHNNKVAGSYDSYGIVSFFGTGNTIRGNRLGANGLAIWAYAETSSQFLCNVASHNAEGIGIGGFSTDNIVRGNISNFNDGLGFFTLGAGELPDVIIEPVAGNLIQDNIALGNAFADVMEFMDGGPDGYFTSPECGNTWVNNHFGSAVGPCNYVPVTLDAVDVCGMSTGVLMPGQ